MSGPGVTGTPVLHLLAGPNGAGKSTLFALVIEPETGLEFVNADLIAADRWPGDEVTHAYEAATLASEQRARLLAQRSSFATETVFSHRSKVDLIESAADAGYMVTLHVVMIPVELAVARADLRGRLGGHLVPEGKVRSRYKRLWALVADAVPSADEAVFYDNTKADTPFRVIARFSRGQRLTAPTWPAWTPAPLTAI